MSSAQRGARSLQVGWGQSRMRFAGRSLVGRPRHGVKLDTWATLQTWEKAVGDGIRVVSSRHRIEQPGRHVLKFWMVTPGIVLERVIIKAVSAGPEQSIGVKPSYLGPPESFRIDRSAQTSSRP